MIDVAVAIGLVSEAMSKTVSRVIGSGLGSTARRPAARAYAIMPRRPIKYDRAGNLFLLDRTVDGRIDALEPFGVKPERRRGSLGQGGAGQVRDRHERGHQKKRAQIGHGFSRLLAVAGPIKSQSEVVDRSIVAGQGVRCNLRVD